MELLETLPPTKTFPSKNPANAPRGPFPGYASIPYPPSVLPFPPVAEVSDPPKEPSPSSRSSNAIASINGVVVTGSVPVTTKAVDAIAPNAARAGGRTSATRVNRCIAGRLREDLELVVRNLAAIPTCPPHCYGFVGLELADKLALAQLASKTKHLSQAQIELRALHKSATSKGFGLIARKAL
jgi:hypothetical protein